MYLSNGICGNCKDYQCISYCGWKKLQSRCNKKTPVQVAQFLFLIPDSSRRYLQFFLHLFTTYPGNFIQICLQLVYLLHCLQLNRYKTVLISAKTLYTFLTEINSLNATCRYVLYYCGNFSDYAQVESDVIVHTWLVCAYAISVQFVSGEVGVKISIYRRHCV